MEEVLRSKRTFDFYCLFLVPKKGFLHIIQTWRTILLDYNFKLKFRLSKRLGHTDGLSRLIPKPCERFWEAVIASRRIEIEIKSMLLKVI